MFIYVLFNPIHFQSFPSVVCRKSLSIILLNLNMKLLYNTPRFHKLWVTGGFQANFSVGRKKFRFFELFIICMKHKIVHSLIIIHTNITLFIKVFLSF